MSDPFRNASISLHNGELWSIYADGFKRAAELLIVNIGKMTVLMS